MGVPTFHRSRWFLLPITGQCLCLIGSLDTLFAVKKIIIIVKLLALVQRKVIVMNCHVGFMGT